MIGEGWDCDEFVDVDCCWFDVVKEYCVGVVVGVWCCKIRCNFCRVGVYGDEVVCVVEIVLIWCEEGVLVCIFEINCDVIMIVCEIFVGE